MLQAEKRLEALEAANLRGVQQENVAAGTVSAGNNVTTQQPAHKRTLGMRRPAVACQAVQWTPAATFADQNSSAGEDTAQPARRQSRPREGNEGVFADDHENQVPAHESSGAQPQHQGENHHSLLHLPALDQLCSKDLAYHR